MAGRCSLYCIIIVNNIKRLIMKAQIFFNDGNLLLLSIFDNHSTRLDIVLNSIHTDIKTRESVGVLNNNVVTVFNNHIFATLPNVNEMLKQKNILK